MSRPLPVPSATTAPPALIRSIIRTEGTTALVATHDAALIDLADRVLELRDGKVIGELFPSRP